MAAKLTPFGTRFPDLFDELFERASESNAFTHYFAPPTNVLETETSYGISLELPGVAKEDVDIELKDGKLWITGDRKQEEAEGVTVHRTESRYGEFRRVVALPKDVDTENVSAEYKDGILSITVAKVEEVQPKKIEITS